MNSFLLLCEHVRVDPHSGAFHVIGGGVEILGGAGPGFSLGCMLLARIDHRAGDKNQKVAQAEIRCIDSAGKDTVPAFRFQVPPSANPRYKHTAAINVGNLNFTRAGEYRFELQLNGEIIATYEFVIEMIPPSVEAQNETG